MSTKKSILITGSTDGIGLRTAEKLVAAGHHVILHGRSEDKVARTKARLSKSADGNEVEGYVADLSELRAVDALATSIAKTHKTLDVLIQNAGVYVAQGAKTKHGIDLRFLVNSIAPYRLTQQLLPLLKQDSRVINLSSAAQRTVELDALAGHKSLEDGVAYAQSKLALTMWSRTLASSLGKEGPVIVAINPGSLLATKMVASAYGVEGADIDIGAEILCQAALSDSFAAASGLYFDNDRGDFAAPHKDALDASKCEAVVRSIETEIERILSH